jgi:hypothetical protein
MIVCRWCGADPSKDPGVALTRVNEKGVPGVWECTPRCEPDWSKFEGFDGPELDGGLKA